MQDFSFWYSLELLYKSRRQATKWKRHQLTVTSAKRRYLTPFQFLVNWKNLRHPITGRLHNGSWLWNSATAVLNGTLSTDSGVIISRRYGGACLERYNKAPVKVKQKWHSRGQLTYKGEDSQPKVLYPGRERIVDVALWRGRNSNLGQGSELKVPGSSNNTPCWIYGRFIVF